MQLPEEGQKYGFLIWLLFSYCGLLCIACISMGKVSHAYTTSRVSFNSSRTLMCYRFMLRALLCFCFFTLYVMCSHWHGCVPRASKMSVLLLFDCYVLIIVHEIPLLQWMTRRQAHLLRAQQGIPFSEYGVSS